MPNRDAAEVLQRTQQMLEVVEVGLGDLAGDDEARRVSGLLSVVVFGRAVTNVLQGLRSALPEEEFDEWYEPWEREMSRDKLMRFFYKMRSSILKEGDPGTPWEAYTFTMEADVASELGNAIEDAIEGAPPDARLEFNGPAGEVTWLVKRDDGTIERQVLLKAEEETRVDVERSLAFAQAPKRHRGKKLTDESADVLADYYVSYLRDLVAAAKERFGVEPRLFEPPGSQPR